MTTTHTLRDPDNRDDDGSPFEVTGDAERIATYLDMLAERDMRTLSGRQAVQDLATRVRYEGTVTPEVAEDIRLAAGVYVTAIVPKDDRTVQVPVSLIERIAASSIENPDEDALIELSALLSQPTPTADSDRIEDVMQRNWDRRYGAPEPPRPEDMAPGTTFTASRHGVADLEEFKIAPSGRILCRGWRLTSWHQSAHHLNSSTIRDVTPPKGDDRG